MEGNILQLNIELFQFAIGLSIFVSTVVFAWANIKFRVGHLEKNFARLEHNFAEFKDTFIQTTSALLQTVKGANVGIKQSPMKPNETGKKLLTESGWNSFYPKIRDAIFSKIDARQPATLYDAEQAAYSALNDLRNHPGLNSVKDYTVEVSEFPLDIIFMTASWVIRDDYAFARGLKSAFAK